MAKIKGMIDCPMKTSVYGWEPLSHAISMVNNVYRSKGVVAMVSLAPGEKIEGEFNIIIHVKDMDTLVVLMLHWGVFIGKDQLQHYKNLFQKYYPSGF